jgi:undecaprenyl-diphosphatase
LPEALLLGALQGPTEVLPISSSGHTTVVPWLLGWGYESLDADARKAFEVALHAGAAMALAGMMREEFARLTELPRRRAAMWGALALAPAVFAGYLLERPIEQRLGTAASVACGLIAGGAALAWADRAPQQRQWRDAVASDALWLGIAQACALVPGVSRSGATLAMARARGFARRDAHHLSRQTALPVIVGAAVLKGARLRASGLRAELRAPFAIGVATSFASTLASKPLLRLYGGERPLAPIAIYRVALGSAVLLRLRSGRPGRSGRTGRLSRRRGGPRGGALGCDPRDPPQWAGE